MAISVSVQYNSVFPRHELLTLSYYHRGTRLNAMKMFLPLQTMFPPKRFENFSPVWGISEGLNAFRLSFKFCVLSNVGFERSKRKCCTQEYSVMYSVLLRHSK